VRDLAVLLLHLLATVARLAGPGGARSVVAESVFVKHRIGAAAQAATCLGADLEQARGLYSTA
jgi:hypothetical protein